MQDALTATIEIFAVASALYFFARFVALVASPGRPSARKSTAPIAQPTAPLSSSQAVPLDDTQLMQTTHTPYTQPLSVVASAPQISIADADANLDHQIQALDDLSELATNCSQYAKQFTPKTPKAAPKTRKKAPSIAEKSPLKTLTLRGKKYVPVAELPEVPTGLRIYSVRNVQAVRLDELKQ